MIHRLHKGCGRQQTHAPLDSLVCLHRSRAHVVLSQHDTQSASECEERVHENTAERHLMRFVDHSEHAKPYMCIPRYIYYTRVRKDLGGVGPRIVNQA